MSQSNETTTKFKVDISELQKAMQEAKRAVAVANSEFKAVSSSMDDWTKSSDGLSAKLKQLDTTLNSQKSVLSNLERQYELTVKQFGEGSKAADDLKIKINNQKAAINKTEKEITKFESALDELSTVEDTAAKAGQDVADGLEEMGDSAKEAEGGFTVLKGAIATFVGNALTKLVDGLKEGITNLVSFADEANNAMNSFQASTGATAEEMAEFNDVMKKIYKGNYGESFDDIAGAMGEIKRMSGDIGADELEKMTTKALILRDTFDFEVSESMRATNSLMDQFGISADEAFTLMAQGAQSGLNQNGDLMDVINEYSVHFQRAGYSAEDMFNMLSNGVEAGTWSVDKLGDAVKEFNIRMSDGSAKDAVEALGFSWEGVSESWSAGGEEAKEIFNMLINEMDGMEDSVEGYGIGVGLLGTMFEDLGFDAVYALTQTEGEITNTKDALEEINAVKYKSVGNAISGIGRSLKTDILMPLGEKLLPIISDLAVKFEEWLNNPKTQEGIKNLTDRVAEFVENGLQTIKDGVNWFLSNKDYITAGIAGIATALGALAILNFKTLITSFKTWASTTKLVTAAQSALNVVMNMNPIGIIITLIAGLVAAFVVLWNKSDSFREFWINLWDNITSFFKTAWEGIVAFFTETIPNLISNIGTWFSELPSKIWEWLVNTALKIAEWGMDIRQKAIDAVTGFIDNVVTFFKELPSKIWEWLVNTALKIAEWGMDIRQKAIDAATGFIDNVVTFFKELPSKLYDWLVQTIVNVTVWSIEFVQKAKDAAKNFIDNVITFFKELPSKIWEWLVNTATKAAEWSVNMQNKAKETAKNFIDNLINFFKELPSKIWEWLKNTATKAAEWSVNMQDKAKETAKNFIDNLISFFKELPSKIGTWLKNTFTKVSDWGMNMREKATDTASSFVSKIVDFVKELPSKIGDWLKNTINKVTNFGINLKDKATSAGKKLVDGIVDTVKGLPEKIKEIGSNIVEGLWNGIKNMGSWIKDKVGGFFGDIVSGVKDKLGINSPSKVFADEVGKWIPEGIAVGIDKNAKSVLSSMRDLTADSVAAAREGVTGGTVTGGVTNSGAVGATYNFYQTNNSPKALSRLEIYRQSKNLLGFAGGA